MIYFWCTAEIFFTKKYSNPINRIYFYLTVHTIIKIYKKSCTPQFLQYTAVFKLVRLAGIEPVHIASEATALSAELQAQIIDKKYF